MTTIPTCTVTVTAAGGTCGEPAVSSFTSKGKTYHECTKHTMFVVVGSLLVDVGPEHPPTKTKAPFVLVSGGKIVGYAHSTSEAVTKRVAKLGAKIVPVTR